MAGSRGLRERKKHETRLAISAAALELATAHGPANITVEDIAAAADVSPRTVFNYFPNKESAILGIDADRREALVQALSARPRDESPLQALQAVLLDSFTPEQVTRWRTRAHLARVHPQLHSSYLQSWGNLEEALTGALAKRAGITPDTDPYPRLVVAVTVTAMRVAVGHAIETGRTDDLAHEVEAAFAAISSGLAAPTPTAAPRRPPRT